MRPFKRTDGKGLVPTFRNMMDDFWGADKFFDDDFFHFRNRWIPAVNITDHEDSFDIDVAAPGLTKDDFKINIENGLLCISAEKETKKEEVEEKFTRREFNYNSFERTFVLPENVDVEKIEAKYVDGVLKLSLKKMAVTEPKTKLIAVK